MKCILIPRHGEDIDNLLKCSENFPSPARKAGQVLVKVQACALAPGDIRVMKGHCDYFQSPRGFRTFQVVERQWCRLLRRRRWDRIISMKSKLRERGDKDYYFLYNLLVETT